MANDQSEILGIFTRTRALVEEMDLADQWFEIESQEEGGVLHGHELTSFSPRGIFDVLRYRGISLGGRIRLALSLLEARQITKVTVTLRLVSPGSANSAR